MTKEKIIAAMVNGGQNKERATEMVNQEFDYVMRVYAGQGLSAKKLSSIISTIA